MPNLYSLGGKMVSKEEYDKSKVSNSSKVVKSESEEKTNGNGEKKKRGRPPKDKGEDNA